MHSPSGSPSDMSPSPPPPPPSPPPPRRPQEMSSGKKSSRATLRCNTGAEASDYPSLNTSLSDKENSKGECPLVEGDIPMATSVKSFLGMPPPPPPPGPPPKRSFGSSKTKRNKSTKNMHNKSDVRPGEEVLQLMQQIKECDSNKVIPNGIVHNSRLTLPLSEGFPGQFSHRGNQWEMNCNASSGKVANVVDISPRLGARAIQSQENWDQMIEQGASPESFLRNGIKVRSMSPEVGDPVRSILPKFCPPVIQNEDHCDNEKKARMDNPPQTRCQTKQSDFKCAIPPGAVELSPFAQTEFFRDFKEEWPSSPHGSSPKKTWTRSPSPGERNEFAGAKLKDSAPQQLDKENDNKRLATATAEAPPSTGKYSPPASVTHEAEEGNTFVEHKLSVLTQSTQPETNTNSPKGEVSLDMSFGPRGRESLTDFEPKPVAGPTFVHCQAKAQRSITEKSERNDDFLVTMPSNEWSKQWETSKEEIPTSKGLANNFDGFHTMQSSTEIKSEPVVSSVSSPLASTECSNAKKSASHDGFVGTTSSDEGLETWILPVRPGNQLVSMDEAEWGESVTKSPIFTEMESGHDWFQSSSFGSETKGTDEESNLNITAAMDKSQAHDVTALVSKPFTSLDTAPTQDSSPAGTAEQANLRTRDETSYLAGAEEKDAMKEATKGKKRRGFFSFFSTNKSKKEKPRQSNKQKTSIMQSALLKGDRSVKSAQSTSLQLKNERAKQPKETKASSSQNAAIKGDQSVQSVLPVEATLIQTSTVKENELSLKTMKTMTLGIKKNDSPHVNSATKLSSHFDKLHGTAAPRSKDTNARFHESRGPVVEMGSNSLIINQNIDCEGIVDMMKSGLLHEKKCMDSTRVMGDGADFQESSGNVDSTRQMPIDPPKNSSVPPFDVSSAVVSPGDPFVAAASHSNAIPTSESAFFGDNFFSSFPSDCVLLPLSQRSGPKPDVDPVDNADAGETPLKMVDTVSSNEEDVDKLAETSVGEFQNKLKAVPSGMTTYPDKARHAVPASPGESESTNANSSPIIGKLRDAPTPKPTVVAEDTTDAEDDAPLQVIDMALSDGDDRAKQLANTFAREARIDELKGVPSDVVMNPDEARDLTPASCTQSDNVNTNSTSHSDDKLHATPLPSLTSPILLHKKRLQMKQRRKQVRESPLALVPKPTDEAKRGPSDKSTCDPSSTDNKKSQTSKGSPSSHLDPPSTAKRRSATLNKEKPQSDITFSSGDLSTDQHVDDTVPDPLSRLHSSIHSERARLIALKQRRGRVGKKKPSTNATASPEKPSQSKEGEKGDDNVDPKFQQPSIMASPRASRSKPEITGDRARAQSLIKSTKRTLPLEKQPESTERGKSNGGIIPEAQKHSPVAAMTSCSSDTRSQSKGTLRNQSDAKNLQSRLDDNASSGSIPDRKPLQPCSPNN